MKLEEKQKALALRRAGCSMNEITERLKVSKSSVSVWVRGVELTEAQKRELSHRGVRKEIIEQRRTTRLRNERARRQGIMDRAKDSIPSVSQNELLIIGAMLYWAEGSKTKNMVQFVNSDPSMVQLMMRFFKEACKVPHDKFRGYIHIHPHLDFKKAEIYWSDVSRIPLNQFYKTYRKPNKGSQNKKDSLPFGTFTIIICSTELLLSIKGWIERVCELYGATLAKASIASPAVPTT